MPFEFENHITHRNFPNSVVNCVIAIIYFDPPAYILEDLQLDTRLSDFFKNKFNLDESVNYTNLPVQIERQDKINSYFFEKDKIGFKVYPQKYRSFVDDVIPGIIFMKEYLEKVLKLNNTKGIQIKKVNLFGGTFHPTIPITRKLIDEVIFSKGVRESSRGDVINQKDAELGIFRILTWQDNTTIFKLKNAWIEDTEKNSYRMIADISGKLNKAMSLISLPDEFLQFNDRIFDLFIWTVDPRVINMLKGEKENE